ncbi:MAG TPA: hypothetical protein VGM49_02095 [Candidatus Limnocylindrales bacterium]
MSEPPQIVRLPVVLIEGEEGPQEGPPRPGNPRVFDSVDALIAAVDPPDVRYGLFQAFDARGRRLRLDAAADAGPVSATLEPEIYAEALRSVLAAAAVRLRGSGPAIDPDLELAGLLAALRGITPDRQAEQRERRRALLLRVGVWAVLMAAIVIAQPPALQATADVDAPILVVLWLVVAGIVYWLAGRLLLLFTPNAESFFRR